MADERIVITRPLPGDPAGRLRDAGYANIWSYPTDDVIPRSMLLEAVAGAHAIIVTPADIDVNAELFDAAGSRLRIVSNYAVGVDNVDLAEAARRGIAVGHTSHAVTEPTADVAWLLLLGAARRAHEATTLVRSGKWKGIGPFMLLGHRVAGRTLHIVGAGRIGRATARRAIGWEMKILYTARSRHEEFEREPIAVRRVGLEEGLAEADFVSLHTPLTAETHHLIDAERLALMKPTAVLVNTALSAVVDEAALVAALGSGSIAAAGLDVYENEPHLHPGLASLDNAYLLPHLGTCTEEDREWMTAMAVENVIAALRGEEVPYAVG